MGNAQKTSEEINNTIKDGANTVKEGFKNTANTIKEGAKNAASTVKSQALPELKKAGEASLPYLKKAAAYGVDGVFLATPMGRAASLGLGVLGVDPIASTDGLIGAEPTPIDGLLGQIGNVAGGLMGKVLGGGGGGGAGAAAASGDGSGAAATTPPASTLVAPTSAPAAPQQGATSRGIPYSINTPAGVTPSTPDLYPIMLVGGGLLILYKLLSKK